MRMGTKSVLYGAHTFWLHPWFVARAWYRLYGFPWDPRLWVTFFVHDLGYWGKPNMDGPEGERHVEWGARFMWMWFGERWGEMCLYHSRYYAHSDGMPPSRLCFADKLAWCLTPEWVYKRLVTWTGEWKEYAEAHQHEIGGTVGIDDWYQRGVKYTYDWVMAHKDGGEDTWTKDRHKTKPDQRSGL